MSDLSILLARVGVRIGIQYHCGRCTDPDAVAKHFGLRTSADAWHQVDRALATAVLRELLEHDLAYSGKADSAPIAKSVAADFIGEFPEDALFFTNSEWQMDNGKTKINTTGFAATDSTFDSGIIALHSHKMGVYWVEDED